MAILFLQQLHYLDLIKYLFAKSSRLSKPIGKLDEYRALWKRKGFQLLMASKDPTVLKQVKISLPFGIGSASWESDPTERKAAWELYIELVTRIAVQPLATQEGLIREALNSLHSLFGSTREILRKAGPDVGASRESVGGIAIAVLNNGLRPFLSRWHPLLQEWEATKASGVSAVVHEKAWFDESQLRQELESLLKDLEKYAKALAEIAGITH